MTIKELKKELGISNKDIAELFGLSVSVYANSTAKKRYEKALVEFYNKIMSEIIIKDNGESNVTRIAFLSSDGKISYNYTGEFAQQIIKDLHLALMQEHK